MRTSLSALPHSEDIQNHPLSPKHIHSLCRYLAHLGWHKTIPSVFLTTDPPLHSSSVFLMHSTHWRYLYHEKDKVLLWPRPLWIFMHVKHFILYEHIVIGIICDKTRPYGIVIYRIYIKDFETWEFSILDRGFGQSYACFHKKRYSCDKLNYVWGGYLE